MEDLDWEFQVIDSPEANAFVLPGSYLTVCFLSFDTGGKVCVFTGILPIVENEEGLATVLGKSFKRNLQVINHHAIYSQDMKLVTLLQVNVKIILHMLTLK